MGDVSLTEVTHLDKHNVAEVTSVLTASTEADGLHPLSEHVLLHVTHGGDDRSMHLLARNAQGQLIGYAHLDVTDEVDGPSAELAVHPSFRQQGVGHQLVTRLLALSNDRLRLWAHGELAAAARLAASMGFTHHRTLWQMRRSLHAALPSAQMPDGITIRPFEVGRDEQAFLELNARAFASLPDQGGWTAEDLRRREHENWFDPSGFLMAWDASGDLAGFHWTKVHGSGHTHPHEHPHEPDIGHSHQHDAIGEVYVLAVADSWRGTGLGRALTLAGLHHLRRLGLDHVMLFVDASNTAAIALYEGLGFAHWDSDVMYRFDEVTRPR
jgi:mycothiol synthase